GALLRIAAYSKYRSQVEQELFDQERALESANVAERIEQGFPEFAMSFSSKKNVGGFTTTHPFDSHPPLAQRVQAVGLELDDGMMQSMLEYPGDGRWFELIHEAESLERGQWDSFEKRFQEMHESTLPFRFIPETAEEEEIVVASFPEVSYTGKEGVFVMDYAKIQMEKWEEAIPFQEITSMNLEDNLLTVHRKTGKNLKIKLNKFGSQTQQEMLDMINQYFTRYQAAVAYREQKQELAAQAKSQFEA
ncbi:MAG: hypothetical protein AAGA30_15300, partial [Planctomycetota bacterium]